MIWMRNRATGELVTHVVSYDNVRGLLTTEAYVNGRIAIVPTFVKHGDEWIEVGEEIAERVYEGFFDEVAGPADPMRI